MKYTLEPIVNSGIPLGGLGTGTLELRADGRFYNWQIFNNPPWTSEIAGCGQQDNTRVGGGHLTRDGQNQEERGLNFVLWARRKGEATTHLRLLAFDNYPLNTNRFYVPYLRTPGKIIFRGEYPQAVLDYQELGLPLQVTGRFNSPFIPCDEIRSATPGFYADFTVSTLDEAEWEVSITAILTNTTGFESPGLPKRNRLQIDETSLTLLMDTPGVREDDPGTGTMALAAEGDDLSVCAGYNWTGEHDGTADVRYQIQDLYREGELRNWPHGQQPPFYAVGTNVNSLSAEERQAFEEACRTHYDVQRHADYEACSKEEPEDQDDFHRRDPGYDVRMDILQRQIAREVRWDGAICSRGQTAVKDAFQAHFMVGWHFPNHIVHDSETFGGTAKRFNMGHEYADRFADASAVTTYLAAERASLQKPTLDFHKALYSSSLPQMVVDQISSQLANMARLSWWTKSKGFGLWEGLGCCGVHTTDVAYNASIPVALFFPEVARCQLELTRSFQREDGRIPHLFPASFNHPNDAWNRTDMMAQFVLMAYRDYCWTGDPEHLRTFYPHCVKAMKCMLLTDRDGNSLADAFGSDTTYDTWGMYGNTSFLSGLFLSAISALEAMARALDDDEVADWARTLFTKGSESYNKELWNGEYLRLWRTADGQSDESCMADQLAGHWYSVMLGLPTYLSGEKVRSILKSIVKYNFVPDHGLRNGAYPEDAAAPLQYSANYMPGGVWTGIEYCVISLLKYYNRDADAQLLLDDVYNRHKASGGIWRHDECGTYYSRPLSAWAVLLGDQHFQYDAAKSHLRLTPSGANHSSPVVVGSGWAVFTKTEEKQTLAVRYGTLSVKSLRLKGSKVHAVAVVTLGLDVLPFHLTSEDDDILTLRFEEALTLNADTCLTVTFKSA